MIVLARAPGSPTAEGRRSVIRMIELVEVIQSCMAWSTASENQTVEVEQWIVSLILEPETAKVGSVRRADGKDQEQKMKRSLRKDRKSVV